MTATEPGQPHRLQAPRDGGGANAADGITRAPLRTTAAASDSAGQRVRALVVAHDDRDAARNLLALRQVRFDVRHARADGQDAMRRALAEQTWDVVIADFRLPGWDDTDALAIVQDMCPDLPVILVCGSVGEDAAVDAIRRGASDCITRAQVPQRLAMAVQRELDRRGRTRLQQRGEPSPISDDLARNLFNINPAPCMLNLPQAAITYVNDRFVELSGYPRAELIGRSVDDVGLLVDDADGQAIATAIQQHGRADGLEFNFRRKDGKVRRAMANTTLVTFDGVQQLLHSFVDLTLQRDALEQARLAKKAFGSISQGVLISDADGRTLSVNRAFRTMTGYSKDDMLGQSCDLLQGRDTDPATVAAIRHAVDAGKPYQGEILNYRKDGTPFWSALSINQMRDANGHRTHFVVIQEDITEQRVQETQRKLTEQIFAQSREGVVVTDAERRIVMVNPAFTSITGYEQAEVLGSNPHILSSGRQDADFYRTMWHAVDQAGSWQGEIWNRHRSGSDYLERLTINVLRDASGRITNYIGTFNDITEQRAAQEKIDWLAHFDTLTGLPNRDLLTDRCAHDISVAQREDRQVAIVSLDMDNFKQINDAMGFAAGNKVIQKFAGRLKRAVRAQDTVARLQGDEFALVLPGESMEGASMMAERLLATLSEPFGVGASEATSRVSIGIAMYPTDGADCEALLKAAQVAMHHAKQGGGNQHRFHSAEMFEATIAKLALGSALRTAIDRDEMSLHYQPFVDMQTGRVGGMEALLRWSHPQFGAVSPGRFIPLAEQTGQIVAIGHWVLRQACRDLRAWQAMGLETPPVSVNLSPLQFRDPNLLANVQSALHEYGIRPDQICLELTEGAVMDDVPHSEQVMHALKDLGVRLSLDDFGTGYSSLGYLKRFPFDKVKIDQSFVRDISSSSQDAVIAKVVISMAHGLGLRVIAEGVETEMQCEFMRRNLCDEIQGYFFSRPVPAQQMQALLQEDRRLAPHLVREHAKARTLLLVDDEPNVIAAMRRLLRADGYQILSAASGPEGLQLLAQHPVDIIVSDQRMPGMTGVEFLRQAKTLQPQTIRIVLSGHTELQSVTDAINEGAVHRFLTKPWDDAQLRGFIEQAFQHKELADENEQLNIKVRTANQELAASNRQLQQVLEHKQQALAWGEQDLEVLRTALDQLPLPVLTLDDAGVVAYANRRAESSLGTSSPLRGHALAQALPALAELVDAREQGRGNLVTPDGRRVGADWHAMATHGGWGGTIITLTRLFEEEGA